MKSLDIAFTWHLKLARIQNVWSLCLNAFNIFIKKLPLANKMDGIMQS